MSKAKFLAARELINEKQYDEARAILNTIDHPTATEWLKKLDKIAPATLNTNNPSQKRLLRNADNTINAELGSVNYFEKNRLKIGVLAIFSTTIVAIFLLILVPKLINRDGNIANSETSQSEETEAFIIYCMKNSDLSQNKCATLAEDLVSNSEFSLIIANCAANYAPDSDSFKGCLKAIDKLEIDRLVVEDIQKGLYGLCSGSLNKFITSSDFDKQFGEANRDEECRNWMVKLEQLYPTAQAINECVGTRTDYLNLFEDYSVLSISFDHWGKVTQNIFIDVANCIVDHLGDKYPDLPACSTEYPERINCTNPVVKPKS